MSEHVPSEEATMAADTPAVRPDTPSEDATLAAPTDAPRRVPPRAAITDIEAATMPGGEPAPAPKPGKSQVAAGDTVGRYIVLDRLGAGAMGVVWAAYDPELDRKVALKLLHADVASGEGARARLLREAQALAKLSHPNVVGIFDTGMIGDQIWIAMEFVDGRTLTGWLDREHHPDGRPWREVMEVMTQAGEGLAAAHAAGLVHRDFKPDNVMVGHDGRVRVMDLGLARSFDASGKSLNPGELASIAAEATLHASVSDTAPSSRVDQELTRAGALVGTPAYMSPEQLAAGKVDGRTDQFAFCVTYWEALYGARPFQGDTMAELFGAISEGRRTPPTHSRVPSWLYRTLLRGLSTKVEDRFPDMQALLSALRGGRTRVRVRRGLTAGLGVVAAAGVGWGAVQVQHAAAVQACVDRGAVVAETWPGSASARRDAVKAALDGSGLGFSASSWTHLEPALDDYVARLSKTTTDVCLAQTVEASLPSELSGRADACLWDVGTRLDGLLTSLESGSSASVTNALNNVFALPAPERCSEAQFLTHMPPPPTEARVVERIGDLQTRLQAARVANYEGKFDEAKAIVTEVLEDEEKSPWAPLRTRALMVAADIANEQDDHEESYDNNVAALHMANEAGDDIAGAKAAISLLFSSAHGNVDLGAAKAWAETAKLMVARAELTDTANIGAALELNLATFEFARGNLELAETLARRAYDLRVAGVGPDHPSMVAIHTNLAAILDGAGRYDEAVREAERAVEITKATHGDDHPDVGFAQHALAGSLYEMGEYERAFEIIENVIENQERAYGRDSERVGMGVMSLSSLHQNLGKYEEGARLAKEAVEIFEKALGKDHFRVGEALTSLGNCYLMQEKDDLAQEAFERSIEIKTKVLGADHISVAKTMGSLADIHRYGGRLDEANEMLDQVLTIYEAAYGPDHPDLAYALTGKSDIAAQRGDYDAAIEHISRVIALRTKAKVAPSLIAESEGLLAEFQWAAGQREAGLKTARGALARYEGLGDPVSEAAAEGLRGWIGEREG